MRFVIAALLVFVVMMINLNSVFEHTAGTSLPDKTRTESQVAFPDRAADPDEGFPLRVAQAAMINVASAAVDHTQQQQPVVADDTIEPPKADFCEALRQAAESS